MKNSTNTSNRKDSSYTQSKKKLLLAGQTTVSAPSQLGHKERTRGKVASNR